MAADLSRPVTVSPRGVALALAVVIAADVLIAVLGLGFPAVGVLDEPAHLATAVVVLAVIPDRTVGWALAFVLGAVAIDADHLPLIFGSDSLTAGTGRPYTHSLLTLLVLALVALALPRARSLVLAFAAGVAVHLSRDLATGGGVALLWPFSNEKLELPYWLWLGAVAAVGLGAIAMSRGARLRR